MRTEQVELTVLCPSPHLNPHPQTCIMLPTIQRITHADRNIYNHRTSHKHMSMCCGGGVILQIKCIQRQETKQNYRTDGRCGDIVEYHVVRLQHIHRAGILQYVFLSANSSL